uniref:UspA domain-containing protein n=1 Tax=Oryza punctata TaxID=4537 RepID=A0A0E0MND8_ORYPU
MAEEAAAAAAASAGAAAEGRMTMVVGVDESEHSYYALQWTLRHFFAAAGQQPQYRLVVVNAKPTAASAVGLAGPGAADVLPFVEADLKKSSMRVIEKAKELCAQVSDALFEVLEGDARNVLCEAVERHQAEMLVVGSHGYGAIKRAVLGSVSDYCSHHAHCTPVMLVGIDDSDHSYYTLEWTLKHFFTPDQPQQYHLVFTSAPPTSALIGIAGLGTAELLLTLELDLKCGAAIVIEKAKEMCSQVIDASYEVLEGDARNVLCEAVERHHADMLVVGSHGYGAWKRAVLGSVSDYCSHHAHRTVMIVKRPKHKTHS